MKYIYFPIVLSFVCLLNAASQNYTKVAGRITPHEATMTSYDKDPDAEAVVLYEIGNTSFKPGEISLEFELLIRNRIKIKILKESGLKYADFEIPFYESEKLKVQSATTYNYENGEIVKTPLDEKSISEEKKENHWRTKKFTMPAVKAGSIVEVEYLIESAILSNIPEHKFQYRIPVIYSNLELRVTPYYEYVFILNGANKFDKFSAEVIDRNIRFKNLSYKEVMYNMGMLDVPAYKDEEFVPSPNDYMASVSFQMSKFTNPRGMVKNIMTTWPELNKEFLKSSAFGKYISDAEKDTKNILSALPLSGKSRQEKTKLIADYIKSNYSWNSVESKFTTKKTKNVLDEKTGNSAELNLLLLGALKNAGIEAQPVMLSTRSHGIVKTTYPFEHFLNYVVVMVDSGGEPLFLDATEAMLPYNELPERCVNTKGLIVDNKVEKWVDITQKEISLIEKNFAIRFNEGAASLEADIQYKTHSFDAFYYRKVYLDDKQHLIDFFSKKGLKVNDVSNTESYDDFEKPFTFQLKAQVAAELNSGQLSVNPFLNLAPIENIFKQDSRTAPVDMIYRHAESFKSKIAIPNGYQVKTLPENFSYSGETMDISYNTVQNGDAVEVSASYTFKQSIFKAEDYQQLKTSYNDIIKAFNSKIIFVKK
ncbi:hypothetical protein FACS1894123_04210 [Bacteroidia bacterium]|nr:hypothetical protein FACS1894123_04210 [Bacteroidia bacterium]